MKNSLKWIAIAMMVLGVALVVNAIVVGMYINRDIQVPVDRPEISKVASESSVVGSSPKEVRKLDISMTGMVLLINNERRRNGVSELVGLEHLHAGALNRAKTLFETKQWSHAGYPEAISRILWDASRAFVGENLAKDFSTQEQVIAAWMNSPTHKNVLLNSRYRYVGIAQFETHWVAWFSDKP